MIGVLMKYLVCDFYDNFECIGSQCPSTCCAGWDILIDKETNAFYDSVAGEFGDALRKNILPVNETIYKFTLGQNGRCPFLTQENLCEIYQKLGPEKMCFTCRTYPRIVQQYGDISFCTLTFSCPEVSRMVLTKQTPVSFFFWEDKAKKCETDLETIDWNFFNTIMSCFTLSVDLLQNRTYPLSVRLRLLLIFTNTLQTMLDGHRDITLLLETFSSPDYIREQAGPLLPLSSNLQSVFSAFMHFLSASKQKYENSRMTGLTKTLEDFLFSCEKAQLNERLHAAGSFLTSPDYDIQYEHLCVYFLFRYYFRAYETRKPLEEVAQLVYLLLIYRFYALPYCTDGKGIETGEQISLFSTISRVFDHNTSNLDALSDNFKKDGKQDIGFLLSLI